MMMYLAPALCLFGGIGSILYTIKVYKDGGVFKLKTLILALVGIPAFIAFMLQIFGIINSAELARGLGTEYYTKWLAQQEQTLEDEIQEGQLEENEITTENQ